MTVSTVQRQNRKSVVCKSGVNGFMCRWFIDDDHVCGVIFSVKGRGEEGKNIPFCHHHLRSWYRINLNRKMYGTETTY